MLIIRKCIYIYIYIYIYNQIAVYRVNVKTYLPIDPNNLHKFIQSTNNYRAIGLMTRVFANGLGDRGSIPG